MKPRGCQDDGVALSSLRLGGFAALREKASRQDPKTQSGQINVEALLPWRFLSRAAEPPFTARRIIQFIDAR